MPEPRPHSFNPPPGTWARIAATFVRAALDGESLLPAEETHRWLDALQHAAEQRPHE